MPPDLGRESTPLSQQWKAQVVKRVKNFKNKEVISTSPSAAGVKKLNVAT